MKKSMTVIKGTIHLDPMTAANENVAKNDPGRDHVHLGEGYCDKCKKQVRPDWEA